MTNSKKYILYKNHIVIKINDLIKLVKIVKMTKYKFCNTLYLNSFIEYFSCQCVSPIGIWHFKRWARILFVVIMILPMLSIPLIGEPIITVPWVYMFELVSEMLSGMLLVLMYTAPIKYYFSKSEKSG